MNFRAEIDALPRMPQHCQYKLADVCLASSQDGVICPEDSCDIDDGLRHMHPTLKAAMARLNLLKRIWNEPHTVECYTQNVKVAYCIDKCICGKEAAIEEILGAIE